MHLRVLHSGSCTRWCVGPSRPLACIRSRSVEMRCCRIAPAFSKGYLRAGRALLALGRNDEAADLLEDALVAVGRAVLVDRVVERRPRAGRQRAHGEGRAGAEELEDAAEVAVARREDRRAVPEPLRGHERRRLLPHQRLSRDFFAVPAALRVERRLAGHH